MTLNLEKYGMLGGWLRAVSVKCILGSLKKGASLPEVSRYFRYTVEVGNNFDTRSISRTVLLYTFVHQSRTGYILGVSR